MVGPSARGSEYGTPSSMMSAPPSLSAWRALGVVFKSGSPATMKGISAHFPASFSWLMRLDTESEDKLSPATAARQVDVLVELKLKPSLSLSLSLNLNLEEAAEANALVFKQAKAEAEVCVILVGCCGRAATVLWCEGKVFLRPLKLIERIGFVSFPLNSVTYFLLQPPEFVKNFFFFFFFFSSAFLSRFFYSLGFFGSKFSKWKS